MMSKLIKSLRAGLLAGAALCAGAAQAVSVSYNAVWDPAFGAPYTNLGWRGAVTLAVDETCIDSGEGISCMFESAAITSAQVTFYDTTAGSGDTAPTIATLNFNPSSMVIEALNYVGGTLTGLITDFSNFIDPAADLSDFNVGSHDQFALFFEATGPRLAAQQCYSYTYAAYDGGSYCSEDLLFNDNVSFPPQNFTITRVPAPASLWLASLGLLALVTVRRVRRA
jgi:hypothetical protein